MSSGYLLCTCADRRATPFGLTGAGTVASKGSVGIYTSVGHRPSRASGGVSVAKIAGPAANGSVWSTTFRCSGCLANNGKSTVGAAVARQGRTAPLIWAYVSAPLLFGLD